MGVVLGHGPPKSEPNGNARDVRASNEHRRPLHPHRRIHRPLWLSVHAWSEYVKGTHDRSPNASMKPKPSVVMSIVVRIACDHEASRGQKTDEMPTSSTSHQ